MSMETGTWNNFQLLKGLNCKTDKKNVEQLTQIFLTIFKCYFLLVIRLVGLL